ncbi:MAG TPA: helix-turn-helix domain-containing protein [Nitrospirota bacterium]|nr:helix-turn-helix domain-containing protein [Nitrospirota bacterium]
MTTMIDKPSRSHDTKRRRKSGNNACPPAVGNTGPAQILIVDDDTALLDRYVESLSDAYRVVSVQTGRTAIERVKRRSDIDLAVIEYRLSDMSGIDVMREIKDVEPSVLVLIATAYGDEEVAVEAFRSGARDYLKKPFSISELSTKIDFYLALRHADKQRRKNILPGADTPAQPGEPPSTVTLSQYHKIQKAVRFINDNYRTDIRLDVVAREACMCLSHFSRIFKKVMGLSYQEYLNSRRITKAKNLLRTTPRNVAEIAVSLGFADPTGFGRIFKKLTSQTPSAYRSLPRN